MTEEEVPECQPDDEVIAVEEEVEPTIEELLAAAEARAEKAEAEITYRDAEIQNIRKRSVSDRTEAVKVANLGMARQMVGVLDDVDRALKAIPDQQNGPLSDGIRLLRERLWKELSSAGVTIVNTEDAAFDPKIHEAISTLPATEDHPAGKIIEVVEPGYRYKDRLLRAARVVVSAD